MMTNIGKTKVEIILELVLSLNAGGFGYFSKRVDFAIEQYNMLVEKGIIKETEHCQEEKPTDVKVSKLFANQGPT
jgi:peroxiredoxin